MNKIHLTPEQRTAILAAINRYSERPTFKQYETEQAVLLLVRIDPKPKLKGINNTRPGYHANEIKLDAQFDALKDLPRGWATFSVYDSGGNHRIENAAVNVWRSVWNSWYSRGPREILNNVAN